MASPDSKESRVLDEYHRLFPADIQPGRDGERLSLAGDGDDIDLRFAAKFLEKLRRPVIRKSYHMGNVPLL